MRDMKRASRDDRGAVLILVAVFSLVAIIFLAFVIDIGNQRQNRRQLNSGTDSAALALSQEWIADPANFTESYDCDSDAIGTRLIDNNDPGGVLPTWDCSLTEVVRYRSGVLTVESDEAVDYAFGGATGVDSGGTGSLTSVLIQPVVGGGVRPVALCTNSFDTTGWSTLYDRSGSPIGFQNPTPAGDTFTLTNAFSGPDNGPCDVSGNWNSVLLRFDNECPGDEDNSGGATEFEDQYENGSPYDVAVNDCVTRKTGSGGLNSTDLQSIEGKVVWLPTFESAEGGGAGIFLVKGFLEVYVHAVNEPTGSTKEFVLEPRRYLTSGVCCLVGDDNAVRTVCDVGTIGGGVGSNDDECDARDLSSNDPEPEIPDEELECGIGTWARTPANPSYNASQDRINQPLASSVPILNEEECGELRMFLVSPTTEVEITTGFDTPTLSGGLARDHTIWQSGNFRVEVRNDGVPMGAPDTFTL